LLAEPETVSTQRISGESLIVTPDLGVARSQVHILSSQLGSTDILLDASNAASPTKPAKLAAFFSYLVATRRKRLIRLKNRSIRLP